MSSFGITQAQQPVAVKDEGLTVTPSVISLDFTGAGVTATGGTPASNVTVNIPGGSGGTMAYDEVPSGSIDGVNTTFTLAHTPNPSGSLILQLNQGFPAGGGIDYSISGDTITMVVAPPPGSTLIAKQYQY